MAIPNELISQLVKITNDRQAERNDTVVYGTIKDDGTRKYVEFDGSDIRTPVETTVEIRSGDRVTVSVRNHTATVTGNISDPAIGTKTADGLRSSIEQTAEEIRMELSNEVSGLESSLKLTAEKIESRIDSDYGEFSVFRQTLEGFAFMGKGGTVKIQDGDLELTGKITFKYLAPEVNDKIDELDADLNTTTETADSALTKAQTAHNLAGSAYDLADMLRDDWPDYLEKTRITATDIISPTIIGGQIYAVDEDSFTELLSDGFHMYLKDTTNPKFSIEYNYTSGSNNYVQLILGSGQINSDVTKNRFFIKKGTDRTGLYYYDRYDNLIGFTFMPGASSGSNGTIVPHGVLTATWG